MDKCTCGYQSQVNPPTYPSKDALTTGTPNQFLWTNAHLDTRVRWTPLPIQHRDLDYQYTKSVYMDKCTLRYQSQMNPTHIKLQQKLYIVYSFTFYTALYMLSLYISCHLELSNWTGQSCIYFYRTFLSIYLWLYYVVVVVVVVVYYTTTTICCCVLHNNNKDNYKVHINWLWSLC